jgi:hypothetical protein
MTTTRKQYGPKFKSKMQWRRFAASAGRSSWRPSATCTRCQIGQWRKTAPEQLADPAAAAGEPNRISGRKPCTSRSVG